MSGLYVRNFRWNYRWEGQRVILRFDGVLFGYEVWLNGKYVGRWGSAYNMAQWDVTDKLVKGRNTIAVKVITRSHGWLFDTNDCWALAGIFRSVELFTVSNDYIEDVVFRTDEILGHETLDERITLASQASRLTSKFLSRFRSVRSTKRRARRRRCMCRSLTTTVCMFSILSRRW